MMKILSENMNYDLIKKIAPLVILLLLLVMIGGGVFIMGGGSEPAENRSFFDQFIISGGPIVWFILLPMSLATVYLAIEAAFSLRRKMILPAETCSELKSILDTEKIERFTKEISQRNDIVSSSIEKALQGSKSDPFRLRSVFTENLNDNAFGYLRKIEWLNLIGNISPMVGLFGTVFGMIKLFNTIVIAGGQPRPAQLAEGISIALVTTFWGLFIAIPSLTLYSIFKNKIESLASDAMTESEPLLMKLRSMIQNRSAKKNKTKSAVHLKKLSSE